MLARFSFLALFPGITENSELCMFRKSKIASSASHCKKTIHYRHICSLKSYLNLILLLPPILRQSQNLFSLRISIFLLLQPELAFFVPVLTAKHWNITVCNSLLQRQGSCNRLCASLYHFLFDVVLKPFINLKFWVLDFQCKIRVYHHFYPKHYLQALLMLWFTCNFVCNGAWSYMILLFSRLL